MYKRILAAVDGSDISNRALQEGLELAKDQQALLRIVHVVDTMPPATGDILDQGVTLARQADVEVETALVKVRAHHPSAGILDEAEGWSADLIVMGTHGRSGLTHLLVGSAAEGVVRKAPVPVLLICSACLPKRKPAG